jgi:outer membrane protein assembly factor BamB
MNTHAFSWMRGCAGRYAAALGAGVLALSAVAPAAARPLMAGLVAGFSRWRGRSRVLTAAVVGMVLAVGVFASPAAAVTASITLKPSSGPPTSTVTVTGTGFGVSETVAVDFSSTQVATATTSATGTFSATFTVPRSASPGNGLVKATGQTSGRFATKNFLVRANWAKFHSDAANSGLNPYENVISPANVSGLKTAWTWTQTVGSVYSSPAVANGVVYVGSTQGNLYAFSASGAGCSGTTPKICQPLWTGTTGSIIYSSPVVASGVVYVAAGDGKLYAFSATTGAQRWTAPIAEQSGVASPVVVNGVVYVTSGTNGHLYAFNAATGAQLWTAVADGGSSPAVSGGVVYVAGLNGLDAFSTTASAPHCSGTPPNKTCTPLWTGTTFENGATSPAVANGVVYLGSGDGKLYAFNATTHARLWTAATGNSIYSTPAVAGGMVYIASTDGNLYAFKTATGAQVWTAAKAGGATPLSPSPAVANGVVYAGSDGQLYAFSEAGTTNCTGTPPNKTCNPLWTGTSNGNATLSSPAVANGMVYEALGGGPSLSAYKLP